MVSIFLVRVTMLGRRIALVQFLLDGDGPYYKTHLHFGLHMLKALVDTTTTSSTLIPERFHFPFTCLLLLIHILDVQSRLSLKLIGGRLHLDARLNLAIWLLLCLLRVNDWTLFALENTL